MRRLTRLIVLGLTLAGCTQPAPSEKPAHRAGGATGGGMRDATPSDDEAVFRNLSFRREGGIGGGQERLLISNTGSVAVSGRTFGNKEGRLSRKQLAELAEQFEGVDAYDAVYPPPPGARDDFQYLIVYGSKVIRLSDANPSIPEPLRTLIASLETLARELPAR